MEDHIEFTHAEIATSGSTPSDENIPIFDATRAGRKFDTVVMKCVLSSCDTWSPSTRAHDCPRNRSPPFGSWTKGIDMVFLELACQVGPTFCPGRIPGDSMLILRLRRNSSPKPLCTP